MGRTATAFLVLIAVGGCVADDQGPAAAVLAAQQGQPIHASAPSYATWSHADQFAALQDSPPPPPPPQLMSAPPPAPAPAPTRMTTTTTLKPTAERKPFIVPGDKPLPGSEPGRLAQRADGGPGPGSGHAGQHPRQLRHGRQGRPREGNRRQGRSGQDDRRQGRPGGRRPPQRDDLRRGTADRRHRHNRLDAHGQQQARHAQLRAEGRGRLRRLRRRAVGHAGRAGAHAWKKGEIVAQTNHSFTVEVKEEGLYGFTLLARNGSGVGKEDAPAADEQPQVWVMVDVTKPTVQISSVEITRTGKAPTVEVHWSAKDKNLGPKPITLSYAEQSEGPWTPIAAGVENSGQYEWQPTGGAAPALPAGRGRGHAGQQRHGADGQPAASGPGRGTSSPRRRRSLSHKTLPAPPPWTRRGPRRHHGRRAERQLNVLIRFSNTGPGQAAKSFTDSPPPRAGRVTARSRPAS